MAPTSLARPHSTRSSLVKCRRAADPLVFVGPEYSMENYGEGGLIRPISKNNCVVHMAKQARRHLGVIEKMCAEASVVSTSMTAAGDFSCGVIVGATEKAGCDLMFMASRGRRGLFAMCAVEFKHFRPRLSPMSGKLTCLRPNAALSCYCERHIFTYCDAELADTLTKSDPSSLGLRISDLKCVPQLESFK